MPKIVDPTEKKTHIAKATWRVILEQGVKGATVRNIAKEAGLSLGALRHYFSTQDELLAYAMNLVKDRATARIEKIGISDLPPKEKVIRILLELVPVDDIKMAEMEVWFAFTFHRKYAEEQLDTQHEGFFSEMGSLIEFLDQHQLLRKDLDKEMTSEHLYALVDGLALHALLEPERLDRKRVADVLTHHINSICRIEKE
ncbi:TetR/AcrR family transcriptional regulator [Paenibacillus wynnii]|uniref:TetR family transcriptional regulator n=1 Tax=Paenibacillus wynnii TaxID=268407 RepID=A0A098MHM7_9BACL|nr:TetR/AcrR family transcriptional regulator [Paenibacillus wynnii]KGE21042.1 TetR family transcriptional regulator [Paenibacillus wynnii]